MKGLTAHNVIWLRHYVRESWHVEEDGRIAVEGNVTITDREMEKLPVKFSSVTGTFKCMNCSKLKSTEGFPEHALFIEMENCLFPLSYYLKSTKEKLTLEETLYEDFESILQDSELLETVKNTFPDLYEKKRGAIAANKFGF